MLAPPLPSPAGQAQPTLQNPAAPVTVHDVTVVTTNKLAQARVLGVPGEEWGIERNARDIRTCNYCFHDVVTKSRADLIDEGYDETDVMSLEPYVGNTDIETVSRDTVQEHFFAPDSANGAAELVRITEHYVRLDYEGTGRPCLYQVVTGGARGTIMRRDGKPAVIKFDQIPFAAATPVPQPHRFFGRSIADQVMDIQREKTALKRGALDNLYLVNNPRVEVSEANAGPNTLDDLLVSRPGGVVRTKTPGGLNWQVVPDVTKSIFPMLEYLDTTREMRTGVTRQGQGVDANALQNQTATAVNQVFTMSQARMKLIARILAETGLKDLFMLLHATIRKHGQQAQTVRLRNKWVNVDPRNWKTRNDLTINVGLGNGGRAERFAQMMAIANAQKELLAGGKANLVGDRELFNTASELCKLAGHKNPDQFFNDPTAKDPQTGQLLHPPTPPPPDPKVQIEQMRQQGKQQELAQQGQLTQQQAAADAYHQQVKTQGEITLASIKADIDAKLALLDAHLKAMAQMQTARHDQQAHHMAMAESAMGMVHDHQKHQQNLEAMRNKPKPKGNA